MQIRYKRFVKNGKNEESNTDMDTKDKQQLTPEQRRRRMELRKRKQRELQRRRRKKRILIGTGIAAGVIILALIIFLIVKLTGGPATISAKGETFVIVLDPGHGGEDTGMTGVSASEKDIDLKICSKLKIMLESQGYQVVLTREDDTRLSKEERVALANESGADLLVSVHCNYSEDDTGLTGAASSYQDGSRQSEALAENIQSALTDESGAADKGTKAGNYTILNDAEMPAVLVEAGYLSNETEAANLADDVYQNDVAKGIARGIIASLSR